MKKIAILGVGAFGFAILKHLDRKNTGEYKLYAYDVNPVLLNHLKNRRTHPIFHKYTKISKEVIVANNYEELVLDADILVLSIRSDVTRFVLEKIKPYLKKDVIIVNVAKALDHQTGQPLSKIINYMLPNIKYAVFAGGTIATDLLKGEALGTDIACKDKKTLEILKNIFHSENLHVYTTTDVTGVEYASSFKNVISILAGILHGLGYSYGTETHFISRASFEVKRLVSKHFNTSIQTFTMERQCWGNDLWMSCTGNTRNRAFGIELGKGKSLEKAMKLMEKRKFSIEGLNTLKALSPVLMKYSDKFPILSSIHKIVLQEEPVRETMLNLLSKAL